jgi:hypothetical protein
MASLFIPRAGCRRAGVASDTDRVTHRAVNVADKNDILGDAYVPDAALRHGERQEQGTVLHAV